MLLCWHRDYISQEVYYTLWVKTKSKYYKKYYKFWWKRIQTYRIHSIFIFCLLVLPKFPLQLTLGMPTITKHNLCHNTFIILVGEIDRIQTESSTLQRMQVKQRIHILTRTRQGGRKKQVSCQSGYVYFTRFPLFLCNTLWAHFHPLHTFFRPHSSGMSELVLRALLTQGKSF